MGGVFGEEKGVIFDFHQSSINSFSSQFCFLGDDGGVQFDETIDISQI